jgi:hypothetical protein
MSSNLESYGFFSLALVLVLRASAEDIPARSREKIPNVLSMEPAKDFRTRSNETPSKTHESISLVKAYH